MKTLIMGAVMTSIMFLIPINTNAPLYSQQESNQENDLVLEVQGLRTSPMTKNFQLSGEVWKKVCPSNQCHIEEDGYSSYIVIPEPEDTPFVYHTIFLHSRQCDKQGSYYFTEKICRKIRTIILL